MTNHLKLQVIWLPGRYTKFILCDSFNTVQSAFYGSSAVQGFKSAKTILTAKKTPYMNSEAGRFSYCAGIFLICAGTAIITLVPSVFPALILGSIEGPKYPGTPDVFELGVLAYPVLIANIILTVLVILHATKKIPKSFYGPIRYMQNHDVSRKVALVTIVIIFAGYLSFTAGEIYQGEPWEDYTRTVKPRLDSWSIGKMFDAGFF